MVRPYWVGHSGVTNAHFDLTACSALWLIAYCPGSLHYLNCSPYSGYVKVTSQKWKVKNIYQFFWDRSKHVPHAVLAWSKEWQSMVSQEPWEHVCRNTSCITDVKLHSLYPMFLNRGYATNTLGAYFLPILENCSFCKVVPEMYTHVYWDCPAVRPSI